MKAVDHHLTVRVIRYEELTETERAQWTDWHQADPLLWSPYFHPAFTEAVAAVRGDVSIAVLEDDDGLAGFFPFQRNGLGFGRPVGGRLSDFHGLIAQPGLSLAPEWLLEKCGLASWNFTHLPTAQTSFRPYLTTAGASRYLDLSDGFEAYVEERKGAGSNTLRQTQRKERKMEREIGPLRLVYRSADPALLDLLFRWKSEQYRRTGLRDVFAFDWTKNLLRQLLQKQSRDFEGMLSALFVGETPVALHFGMASRHALHYWFPVYDPRFRKYSPGSILLLELARQAAEEGKERADLGRGDDSFKVSFGSGSIEVASGAVDTGSLLRSVRQCWTRTRGWLKTSPFGAPARLTARLTRPLREWLSFR